MPCLSASCDGIVNGNDVNHSYRKFVTGFFRKPLTTVSRSEQDILLKKKHKPWMTKGIVIKNNLLYKRFLTSIPSTS